MTEPLEVISSEDLLSRIEKFNGWVAKQETDWRESYMLLGSNVTALFPSLTKERTAQAVNRQAKKSEITWTNIDEKSLTLYIHLNRYLSSNVDEIAHLIPKKRPHKRGREPGMSSFTCMQRHLEDEYVVNGKTIKNSWIWSDCKPSRKEVKILMAILLEISVSFFFDNFVYTFGGKDVLQCGRGTIGGQLTMCISRLTMQDWWELFVDILERSDVKQLMNALYVDKAELSLKYLKRG